MLAEVLPYAVDAVLSLAPMLLRVLLSGRSAFVIVLVVGDMHHTNSVVMDDC